MTPNQMYLSLLAIEAALQRLGRWKLLRSLQPGSPPSRVQDVLGVTGLRSSIQLETLYGWHDGTQISGSSILDDLHIIPGFYILSVEDAIANYRAFMANPRWKTGWLPVLANGGGDFYVVDLNTPDSSVVRHFRIDEAEQPVEFDSLAAMVVTLAESFERGVFFVTSDGYLEMDDLVFGELAGELNPAIDWWRN